MNKSTVAVSLVIVAFASALFGAFAGATMQRQSDAPMQVAGDQLNRLALVGLCAIEPGDKPFANCSAKRLAGVAR